VDDLAETTRIKGHKRQITYTAGKVANAVRTERHASAVPHRANQYQQQDALSSPAPTTGKQASKLAALGSRPHPKVDILLAFTQHATPYAVFAANNKC
jgi:hypothetical protein